MGTFHRAAKNNDAKLKLREGGDAAFVIDKVTSNTNSVFDVEEIKVESSGTEADGLGAGRAYQVMNDAGSYAEIASIDAVATDVSSTSEDGKIVISTAKNGTVAARVEVDGDGLKVLAGGGIDTSAKFEIFDDFTYQTLTEADTPWILNSGADAQAIDPAINAQEGGVVRLTSGDAGSGVANDGSQIICHIPVQADSGGLVFETRLHINTAVTDVQVCAGLTDVTTLELPASVGGSDAITTTFSNGCVFCYDTGADTDEWFAIGVDGDTDATGNAATGTAPTADTYQKLRIEVDADGEGARFYIDGTLAGTLTAAATAASTNLYATVIVNATTTTSKTLDVDYIKVSTDR